MSTHLHLCAPTVSRCMSYGCVRVSRVFHAVSSTSSPHPYAIPLTSSANLPNHRFWPQALSCNCKGIPMILARIGDATMLTVPSSMAQPKLSNVWRKPLSIDNWPMDVHRHLSSFCLCFPQVSAALSCSISNMHDLADFTLCRRASLAFIERPSGSVRRVDPRVTHHFDKVKGLFHANCYCFMVEVSIPKSPGVGSRPSSQSSAYPPHR